MKDTSIAKLTIHGLPDMTEARKKRLLEWLKGQIKVVTKTSNNKDYAKVYTARIF